MAEADNGNDSTGGAIMSLLRALGTMLGLHIQYAQREAKNDIGRLLTGVVLVVCAVVFAVFALVFGHLALIHLVDSRTVLGPTEAIGAVAGGDLVLGLLLGLMGRARLRKPVLEQTRSLVKRTVASLADV